MKIKQFPTVKTILNHDEEFKLHFLHTTDKHTRKTLKPRENFAAGSRTRARRPSSSDARAPAWTWVQRYIILHETLPGIVREEVVVVEVAAPSRRREGAELFQSHCAGLAWRNAPEFYIRWCPRVCNKMPSASFDFPCGIWLFDAKTVGFLMILNIKLMISYILSSGIPFRNQVS